MGSDAQLIILFGGESSERLVSVASAQHVASLIPHARCWFWAPHGAVYEVPHEALLAHKKAFECAFEPGGKPTFADCEAAFDTLGRSHVVFLALHGVGGEDGLVQTWLEARKIPFTGSSAAASRCAFDKRTAKQAVASQGGRVAAAAIVRGSKPEEANATLGEFLEKYDGVVVKPVADGSSHGLCIVEDEDDVTRALAQLASEPHAEYLAEQMITGREITVGVYDAHDGICALPASEVVMERGRRFDYQGKYLGQGSKEITPAELPETTLKQVQALAILAHQAVGCLGYSRTDMIVDDQGPVFLEINNLPGMTRASFIPQQLTAAGIPIPEFLARQLELAQKRYENAQKRKAKPATTQAVED